MHSHYQCRNQPVSTLHWSIQGNQSRCKGQDLASQCDLSLSVLCIMNENKHQSDINKNGFSATLQQPNLREKIALEFTFAQCEWALKDNPDLRKRKKASSTQINHKWQSLLCGRKRFTILHLTSAIPWSIAGHMIARGLLYLLAEMDCWVSNPAFNIPNYAPTSSHLAAILWVVFSINAT